MKEKLIKKLQTKKHREITGLFLVEGEKSVIELLESNFQTEYIVCTKTFEQKYKNILKKFTYHTVTKEELEGLSSLQSNKEAIAIAKQKKQTLAPDTKDINLVINDIKDPGNLGTIIRIADWYGLTSVIASYETVDVWNNKTIQSSMGSFTRVSVYYTDLKKYLKETSLPIYGAYLEGESVHSHTFKDKGVLIIGNESIGIKKELEPFIKNKITIPRFGKAESLNASIATAIILDNWKRSLS